MAQSKESSSLHQSGYGRLNFCILDCHKWGVKHDLLILAQHKLASRIVGSTCAQTLGNPEVHTHTAGALSSRSGWYWLPCAHFPAMIFSCLQRLRPSGRHILLPDSRHLTLFQAPPHFHQLRHLNQKLSDRGWVHFSPVGKI